MPVTVAGDASLVAYDWDTTTVAAGWWQVQVEYGPGRVYERRLIVQPSAAGVPGAAAVGIGPGTAFAATGEYQVGATDVTDDGYGQTLALRRVWSTRTATTPGAAGWGCSAPDGPAGSPSVARPGPTSPTTPPRR